MYKPAPPYYEVWRGDLFIEFVYTQADAMWYMENGYTVKDYTA